ncbi:hypothetical protein D8B26_005196 [Coccidioides posadasii str. Silveira]|uniref:Uncharacterized protein n=2 Tax=Coccidioides posadasii TaxID=199306 RepID=E9D664_COCPS|nr:hypothetical protein CPC735_058490 [Coccidioides posadasii C735 delta SOWgp]EER24479.1 hypothetical protein CPC735_058490 [Coccidioides posadasii C735 delta SOWgp]EFW18408.1 conserved hypothetical protein [Coccidioides posadasii str. Silveira]QVM10538.1 hypothetical protein D8B26_005196 [Coccidioides posadasii str. Silveira]|eukprot:XP_003066624.1 hypothetical protein CPC735_058490 [Coccidioides posadasii C735 delta SOWgp]
MRISVFVAAGFAVATAARPLGDAITSIITLSGLPGTGQIGNPGQQEAPPPPLVELSPDQPVFPTGALGPQQTGAIATGIIPMGTAAIVPSATATGQTASGDPLTFHFPALKAAH